MKITDSKGVVYDSLQFIGKGGMGKIYQGVSPITNAPIVLKLIEHMSNGADEKQKRELVVSNTISHKNVVEIYDSGLTKIDGIEYLYLIEKYYQKGNLTDQIRKGLPIDACYRMMQDLLLGMQEIHKTAIHRDLKPDNILIDDDGSLVISDFGLSRFASDSTHTDTFKGWGTYKYMSPECWTNDKNTPAMDIYSLGLVFFEILTGEFPFNPVSQTREGWRDCHFYSPVPNLITYRDDVSVKLNEIIHKMTAKRVSERYESIDEILKTFSDAKKQSSDISASIECLAQKASRTIEIKNAEGLKRAKEEEDKRIFITKLNANIDELFNRVIAFVNQVNSKLETGKYTIQNNGIQMSPSHKSLTVALDNKSFTISFLSEDDIPAYEKIRKKMILDYQRQQYGLILQPYSGSVFVNNDIVLIGLAETSFKIKTYEYGFNLFLKMSKEANLGEWYICQFSENITPERTPFGISLFSFFEGYERNMHSPFFSKNNRKLEDKDLLELIGSISE